MANAAVTATKERLNDLGDIPANRVRLSPPPGTLDDADSVPAEPFDRCRCESLIIRPTAVQLVQIVSNFQPARLPVLLYHPHRVPSQCGDRVFFIPSSGIAERRREVSARQPIRSRIALMPRTARSTCSLVL